MTTKVLVTYASTHGSTQEIAETVAGVLIENGLAVDLQAARSVRSLEGYQAVVLGAPLYMFRWHADARKFLTRFRKVLSGGLPVAIFTGGKMEEGPEAQGYEVTTQLSKELAKFPWLKPASVEIVGGRFDPARLRFPWNLIPALKGMSPTDLRDWDAIRAWAGSLEARFNG